MSNGRCIITITHLCKIVLAHFTLWTLFVQLLNCNTFQFIAQTWNVGCLWKPPRWGASNEYQQLCFWLETTTTKNHEKTNVPRWNIGFPVCSLHGLLTWGIYTPKHTSHMNRYEKHHLVATITNSQIVDWRNILLIDIFNMKLKVMLQYLFSPFYQSNHLNSNKMAKWCLRNDHPLKLTLYGENWGLRGFT